MATAVEPVSTRPKLPFVPLPLEVEPIIERLQHREISVRIVALTEAMAAHVPAERRDEAFRDGLRALRESPPATRFTEVDDDEEPE